MIEICRPRMFWFFCFCVLFLWISRGDIVIMIMAFLLFPRKDCFLYNFNFRFSVRHVTDFNIYKLNVTIDVTNFPLRENQTESARLPFRSARRNSVLQTPVPAVYAVADFTNTFMLYFPLECCCECRAEACIYRQLGNLGQGNFCGFKIQLVNQNHHFSRDAKS